MFRIAILLAIAAGSALAQIPADASGPKKKAQTDFRKRVSGIVHQRNGKPWQGIQVTFHSLAWAKTPEAGGDKVVVTTDARGRFRARLLEGRPYEAWALESKEGEIRYRVTQIEKNVFAGMPIRLREADGEHVRVRVRLEGSENVKASLPLQMAVVSSNAHKFIWPLTLEATTSSSCPQWRQQAATSRFGIDMDRESSTGGSTTLGRAGLRLMNAL